jgi:benzoyl-CoA reductase/2-hydroxyglutaryl-CoA dehydratase subunit BcrC/BadD/HgdB
MPGSLPIQRRFESEVFQAQTGFFFRGTPMNPDFEQERRQRLFQKAVRKNRDETARVLETLRNREDYRPELDYFLNLAADTSATAAEKRSGRPALRLLCLQAPLELIHAAGFQPFKVFSGSLSTSTLATQDFPALICPLLRAVLGEMILNENDAPGLPWVLPTTCDWVVKFPEMLALTGHPSKPEFHWLELPHLKNRRDSRERWLGEIWRLKEFLEQISKRPIKRGALLESIEIYGHAAEILQRLKIARENGRLSSVWFMLILNAFFLDAVEKWTTRAEILLSALTAGRITGGRVFLAGSPIVFPNFKLPFLFEEAGLSIVADDLCSSERLFPGKTFITDTSVFGLISTLAGRYHQGCLCPVFADNDRRINNILGRRTNASFHGIIFHVLKGCHPYDLESFSLENGLKAHGLKFIRLETDYAPEDGQNLLTRLEAYHATLTDK